MQTVIYILFLKNRISRIHLLCNRNYIGTFSVPPHCIKILTYPINSNRTLLLPLIIFLIVLFMSFSPTRWRVAGSLGFNHFLKISQCLVVQTIASEFRKLKRIFMIFSLKSQFYSLKVVTKESRRCKVQYGEYSQ